jgi:hypothetical protein
MLESFVVFLQGASFSFKRVLSPFKHLFLKIGRTGNQGICVPLEALKSSVRMLPH